MDDEGQRAFEREINERQIHSAITTWYSAVDGETPLVKALEQICIAFGADAVGLSRYGERANERPRLVHFDRCPPDAWVPGLSRAYTHCVLGEFAKRAKDGTVWQSSTVSDLDPALTSFQQSRALKELVVCTLGKGAHGYDYLEMHFAEEVSGDVLARIETAAATLFRAWRDRVAGCFFEKLVDRNTTTKSGGPIDLLATENPARLSRAEYRVCFFLSKGLSNSAVMKELTITQATLKTHLKNIYCKTGVENRSELIYMLLSAERLTNIWAMRARA